MSLVGGYASQNGFPPSGPPHSPVDPLYAAATYYPSAARYDAHPGTDGAFFQTWAFSQSPADMSPAEYSPGSYVVSPAAAPGDYASAVAAAAVGVSPCSYGEPRVRVVKRRVTANRKERRRTLSINNAFAELRDCIPNVPSDTKLSKIKTLRLATSYIAYLMDILARDDPAAIPEGGFKAELGRKMETREERRKKEMASILGTSNVEKKGKGRTGWPQHVWALELKP